MVCSVLLFFLSIFITYGAYDFTKSANSTVVPDLILDNIPVFHVGPLFFGGMLVLTIIPIVLVLYNPRRAPFIFVATAIFFTIRSFFMVLTHLAPPNIEYYQYVEHEHHVRNVVFTISSGTDLFFSGHTGYPFLLALTFWKNRALRYFFIVFSLVMAATVLLGHLHYSIDVFAAFFIAYGVFEMSRYFFKKEYSLIDAK